MIMSPAHTFPSLDCFTEFVVEWEDGKQVWTEDYPSTARAVRYRHRFLAKRFIPFLITAWQEKADGSNKVMWELEWTDPSMVMTEGDCRDLCAQRVPRDLLDQLFKHPDVADGVIDRIYKNFVEV